MAKKPIKYGLGTIRQTEYGTFHATVHHLGRRHRKQLPTIEKCKAYIDQVTIAIERNERPLDTVELMDAIKAIQTLPSGVSLVEAAQFYLRAKGQAQTVKLSDALETFLESKRAAGLRSSSLWLLKNQVEELEENFPGLAVEDWTTEMLEEILAKKEMALSTRDSLRRGWKNFFGWCVKRQMATRNPADALEKIKVDQQIAEIVTPHQAKELLEACQAKAPTLTAYLAIQLFAGLRTSEVDQLQWDAVGENIRVSGVVSKTRQVRFVTIQPNLFSWLSLADRSQPLAPMTKRRRSFALADVRKAAGFDAWPKNAARHSFGSYHLAKFKNAALTAHEMGNSEKILFKHYRNLVTEREAVSFFQIAP